MKTLERQLAEYGNRQRELHGPITPDELVASGLFAASVDFAEETIEADVDDPTVEFLHQRPDEGGASSKRRGWFRVTIAAAAVILVVVGVAVVVDPNSDEVVTDPASVPGVTDPPVSSPDAVELSTTYRWSLAPDVEVGATSEGGWMSSVVAGGPGFVAGGRALEVATGTSEDALVAAVWTSTDGASWSRVAHNDAIFTSGGISSVIVGGPGLVAVGTDDSDSHVAAVWTSVDGVTWSRISHDDVVFGGPGAQWMSDVAIGGPGFVAVGHDSATGAAVWTSADGIVWSRVPTSDSMSGEDYVFMEAVIAGGPGLVAVGGDDDDDYASIPTVWTSPDGVNWSKVPGDPAFVGDSGGYPRISSVTTGGPGLVGVGWIDGHAAVWTSEDGVGWSRVPHDERIFGGSWAGMSDVMNVGSGLIAVGTSDGHAVVWTSPDGVAWSRVLHDEALFGAPIVEEELHQAANQGVHYGMAAVAAGPSGLVAVGLDGTIGFPFDPVIWIAEPNN